MSSTIEVLNQKIDAKHLLKHPFYVAWSKGELSLEDLQSYARQYFTHVRAFPAYLSEMHSRCEDLASRQTIAANLADEEATSPTHPDLWLDFAAGLGESRQAVLGQVAGPKMKALVETFRSIAKMDTGLAAAGLYCYENQIPAVSAAKIEGLKANYKITEDDDAALLRRARIGRRGACRPVGSTDRAAPGPGCRGRRGRRSHIGRTERRAGRNLRRLPVHVG